MLRGRAAGLVVLLLLTSLVPAPSHAAQSGFISASESTVLIQPSTIYAGDSVTITVTFINTQAGAATNISWAVYGDSMDSNSRLKGATINLIPGNSNHQEQVVWNSVTEGLHRVYVEFNHNQVSSTSFDVAFEVLGLPDLHVVDAYLESVDDLHSGDETTLQAEVMNAGSEPAEASQLGVQLDGAVLPSIAVPALQAGERVWINTTLSAPATGEHTLRLLPDAEDDVHESNENGKAFDLAFTVDPRMDIRHVGALTLTVEEDALNGPWTVSGMIERVAGDGTTTVPMRLEIATDGGQTLPIAPFDVVLEGAGYATKTWERVLTSSEVSTLDRVPHNVVAVIDPFGTGAFVQEDTTNDRSEAAQLLLQPIPDVYLDASAVPESPTVNSGDRVNWSVFIINTGTVTVRGTLEVTFDDREYEYRISLDGGEDMDWYPDPHLPTTVGEHTAFFEARFEPDSDSWDEDPTNSVATGSVEVVAPLRLTWNAVSLALVDVDGAPTEAPLQPGQPYTMSVNATTIEVGQVNYTCDNGAGEVFAVIPVSVEDRIGQSTMISCTFEAQPAQTTVRFVPSDPEVSTTFSRTWTSLELADDGVSDEARSMQGLFRWAVVFVLLLVGVLVMSVIITRARNEEVDRDIFEYCPSCDGELEGDEDTCPHCRFDLDKARRQFHDCAACGESIPDLLENCPYCGTEQDVASFFEQRQRIQRVETPTKTLQALPEEEDDDDDEIVSGSEDFADAVKAFGYDEDDLDDEWERSIESAEAQVQAAQERLDEADIDESELSPEELEALQNTVTTTLRSVADSFNEQDIDAIIASKGKVTALKDDGSELSASDAGIRERLFELTGEEGVLPGQEVKVGMSLTDGSLAGNEVGEATTDFTFEEEDPIASGEIEDELSPKRAAPKRRAPRRQQQEAQPTVAQCGACGADIAIEATSCSTCGANFE